MKTIKRIELREYRERVAEPVAVYSRALSTPSDVERVARSVFDGEGQEVFIVILIDVKNKPVGYVEVGRGTFEGCPVGPRVVFRAAIVAGATSIIVAHNHPSGDATPSAEDREITRRLVAAGGLLGIRVLDHVVVGEQIYSFAEHNEKSLVQS